MREKTLRFHCQCGCSECKCSARDVKRGETFTLESQFQYSASALNKLLSETIVSPSPSHQKIHIQNSRGGRLGHREHQKHKGSERQQCNRQQCNRQQKLPTREEEKHADVKTRHAQCQEWATAQGSLSYFSRSFQL